MDTHIWLRWIIPGEQPLPTSLVQRFAGEKQLVVSAISCWEVHLLAQRSRIALPLPVHEWITEALAPTGVAALPISRKIAEIAATLPQHHRDPADRMIMATAIHHQAQLASLDETFPQYQEINSLLIRT